MKNEIRAERERQVQADLRQVAYALAEQSGADPALIEPTERTRHFPTQQLLELEALNRFLQAVHAALTEQAKPAPKRKVA